MYIQVKYILVTTKFTEFPNQHQGKAMNIPSVQYQTLTIPFPTQCWQNQNPPWRTLALDTLQMMLLMQNSFAHFCGGGGIQLIYNGTDPRFKIIKVIYVHQWCMHEVQVYSFKNQTTSKWCHNDIIFFRNKVWFQHSTVFRRLWQWRRGCSGHRQGPGLYEPNRCVTETVRTSSGSARPLIKLSCYMTRPTQWLTCPKTKDELTADAPDLRYSSGSRPRLCFIVFH